MAMDVVHAPFINQEGRRSAIRLEAHSFNEYDDVRPTRIPADCKRFGWTLDQQRQTVEGEVGALLRR